MSRQRTLDLSAPSLAFVTEWATETQLGRPLRQVSLSPLAQPRFICASCRVVIRGPATFHVGVAFCCAGCVAGGPCICSYDAEPGSTAR